MEIMMLDKYVLCVCVYVCAYIRVIFVFLSWFCCGLHSFVFVLVINFCTYMCVCVCDVHSSKSRCTTSAPNLKLCRALSLSLLFHLCFHLSLRILNYCNIRPLCILVVILVLFTLSYWSTRFLVINIYSFCVRQ